MKFHYHRYYYAMLMSTASVACQIDKVLLCAFQWLFDSFSKIQDSFTLDIIIIIVYYESNFSRIFSRDIFKLFVEIVGTFRISRDEAHEFWTGDHSHQLNSSKWTFRTSCKDVVAIKCVLQLVCRTWAYKI